MEKLSLDLIQKEIDFLNVDLYDTSNSNLDDFHGELTEAFAQNNGQLVYESVGDFYEHAEVYTYSYISNLKAELYNDFDELKVDDFFDQHADEIKEMLYDADISTPCNDLLNNTSNIPLILSITGQDETTCYTEKYDLEFSEAFRIICKTFSLNPSKLKETFIEYGYDPIGTWRNYPKREGKEKVSYTDIAQEFNNVCSQNNEFVLLVEVSASTIVKMDDSNSKFVHIPEGVPVGYFDGWSGSGSTFDAVTTKELIIPFKNIEVKQSGHSFDSVYGSYLSTEEITLSKDRNK